METRHCTNCAETKPVSAFSLRRNGRPQSWCKSCTNAYSKRRYAERADVQARQKQRAAEWNRQNPDKRSAQARALRQRQKAADPEGYRQKRRLQELAQQYGLSGDDYEAMMDAQSGMCAICGRPPRGKRKHLVVDHCHDTGAVRGLLCSPCNTGIGHLGDDPQILRKAIAYIDQTSKTANGYAAAPPSSVVGSAT